MLSEKGVAPYEHVYDWEKFDETTLPEKEEFYNNLNMEEIRDYIHVKKVCKDLQIKRLR